ncbi:DedA family protein [Acinetobacter bohemicus]|uniref:DedA family protein n=2 Tax=Acinetobacter TaxID=469 RepID=A0A9D2USV3_ACILW|nr:MULTISPECIES: DedA family protein [Acinetobacter]HJF28064.1 DedA family protein [Acinetobacter lwoffii]MCO8043055.1 DedA family protein [Acinetobacter sp. S4400-12]MCO8046489.1 DedA family protein [Acinetobacter sp. S4397-1]MCU7225423.1 DedA family protein [Acinetobacter bohemicus]QKQ68900.1 DedA family protein [Acinetobacter sp. 10FS3-1]
MELIDFILHVDDHLLEFITNYGIWIYAILFLIIFVETGLVVMPFLPGDSLLFAAGALAASTGAMDPWVLIPLLFAAAVLGDTLNYHIGKYIGPRVFEIESRFINKQHLTYTQKFFEKHGGKTIIFARFVPFARTFAPFVAGAGSMNYKYFLTYNVVGALLWISSFVILGYMFGNMPIIKDNFTYLIFGIIILSVMPGIVGFIQQKLKKSKPA